MLKRNASFLIGSLLLMCVIGCVMLACDKAAVHLWLNGYHTPFLDSFFRYYTVIGEWIPYIFVFLLLFYKAGWAAFMFGSISISGLLSQPLKYAFDTDRPYRYFADHLPDVQLPFVDGVTLSKYYSFPSGHTTTFFALFLCLSIVATDCLSKREQTKGLSRSRTDLSVVAFLFFMLAVVGAYSRVYLSQHFLEDILGGMILGIGVTLLLYLPVPQLQGTRFWDWSLQKLFHTKQ